MSHYFLEPTLSASSFALRADPRVKVLLVGAALLGSLLASRPQPSLLLGALGMGSLLAAGVQPRVLALRFLLPAVIGILAALITALHLGETPLFRFSILGFPLTLYEEGMRRGLLIFAKVFGGVSLIFWLSWTTPLPRLAGAALWFRIPRTLVELLLYIYRYLFLLMEETHRMRDAQRGRLGYTTWRRSLHSAGLLGGMLMLRALDRAERAYEAMRCRGYQGCSFWSYLPPPGRGEAIQLTLGLTFVAAVLALS